MGASYPKQRAWRIHAVASQHGVCSATGFGGQGETEHRAFGLQGFKFKMAAMLLDDGAAQTQAQTHAFGFGGEEGREQLLDRY
jgi:hypothetical protein